MLYNADRNIILATPTKCGTRSLEAMLEPLGWQLYNLDTSYYHRHAMTWHKESHRIIVVRDPVERLVSTYFWLQKSRKIWSLGFETIQRQGWSGFINLFERCLGEGQGDPTMLPWLYFNNNAHNAKLFKHNDYIRLEYLQEDCNRLSIELPDRIKCVNKSVRDEQVDTSLIPAWWVNADAKEFGYF